MTIELSEEAFTILYLLKERLERSHALVSTDPGRAATELADVISEMEEALGPGVP